MKKIIITSFMTLILTINTSFAGITNNYWFDPTAACVGAGAIGYAMSTENQAVMAGLACAATGLIVYLVEERGRSVQKSAHDDEVNDLKNALKEYEVQKAQAGARGDDESYSIKVRETVPGYKDSKGNVHSPHIIEKLIPPAEGMRVGE